MYVSIMERKGIEKGIQLGRTEGIQLGRAEGEAKGKAEGRAEGRAEGEAKGRTEGIQLGEARARTETARNLLRMGLEPAKVAEAASLTLEEVDALRGQAG